MNSSRLVAKSAIACVALALVTSAAIAAEVTRDSYRESVEPICRQDTKANERIFQGVRTLVKHGELKRAADRFDRAAVALRRAISQVRSVPQPAGDRKRLSRWLGELSKEASLFREVSSLLRAGRKHDASRAVVRLTSIASHANALVISFEFHSCKLDPSHFT